MWSLANDESPGQSLSGDIWYAVTKKNAPQKV